MKNVRHEKISNELLGLTDGCPYTKSEQTGTWYSTCSSAGKLCTNKEAEFLDVIGTKVIRAVFRIHDILVWIRIRISGSMPLTNGSGFGSGCGSESGYFRH